MLLSIHIPITSFFLIISFISNIRIFFPKYHYFATIKHKKASVSITDTEAFCLYIFLFCAHTALQPYLNACIAYDDLLHPQWMVDHSARLIAAYTGEVGGMKNTVYYAARTGVQTVFVL